MENHKQKGFTLVEILVSVGIIAVIGMLITQAFVSTVRSNTKTELLKDIKQNGDQALNTMIRMVQNSLSIDTASCALASSGGSSITINNPDGNWTRFECIDPGGGAVRRVASVSAARTEYVSSTNMTIDATTCGAIFTCTQLSGQPSAIEINFTLQQANTTASDKYEIASQNFQTSVNVRNIRL